jgi:hypothetical protein
MLAIPVEPVVAPTPREFGVCMAKGVDALGAADIPPEPAFGVSVPDPDPEPLAPELEKTEYVTPAP